MRRPTDHHIKLMCNREDHSQASQIFSGHLVRTRFYSHHFSGYVYCKRSSHPYHRKEVVKHYDKLRSVPREQLYKWLDCIIKDFALLRNEPDFRVFEGGVGTGTISLTLIRILSEQLSDWSFWGIDNSANMINELFKKLEFKELYRLYPDRIMIGLGDLESMHFPQEFFNIAVLGGVLHCLRRPEYVLNSLEAALKNDGTLIIVIQVDPWMRLISGDPQYFENSSSDIPEWVFEFWRTYYSLRHKLNIPVDNRTSLIYSTERVQQLVSCVSHLRYVGHRDLQWKVTFKSDTLIDIIRNGLAFGVGQNVSTKERKDLGAEMQKWLCERGLIHQEFTVTLTRRGLVWRKIS